MMFDHARLVMVVSAAVVIAAGNALINPNRPPWSGDALREGEIRLADVAAAKGTILWLDARSLVDYNQAHMPGALALNEDNWENLLPEVLEAWQPKQWIIVYCSSQKCQASQGVANRLREEVGIRDVYVLKGGWEAWQSR